MQYLITAALAHLSMSMFKQLDVKCTKTTLRLKTLHGEWSENTSAIASIQVKGINGDGNWLTLPRLYVRKDLWVDKEEIEAPEKITEWEYLKSITKEIVQNDDVCIGLLIQTNCRKALEPMQVIANEIRLGWCIVRPIMNAGFELAVCKSQIVI